MGNHIFKKLQPHIGHNIVCVCYGDYKNPNDVCIECADCNEVLISVESFECDDEENDNNDLLCPLDGDETNDCADCLYSGDYHFVDGECLERLEDNE